MYAGPVVQHNAIENHQLNEVTFCERSVETAQPMYSNSFVLGDSPTGSQPAGYVLVGNGKNFHTSNGNGGAPGWVGGVMWGNEGRGAPTGSGFTPDPSLIVTPEANGNVWSNSFIRTMVSDPCDANTWSYPFPNQLEKPNVCTTGGQTCKADIDKTKLASWPWTGRSVTCGQYCASVGRECVSGSNRHYESSGTGPTCQVSGAGPNDLGCDGVDESQNNVLCECGAPMATYLGQRLTLRDDGTIRLVYGVSAAQYASWANPVLIDDAPIYEFLEIVCGGSVGSVGAKVNFLGNKASSGVGSYWVVNADKTISPRDSPKLGDGTPTLVIGWGTFDYAPCYDTPPNEPEGSGDDNLVLVDATRNDVHKLYMVTNAPTPYADADRWNDKGETGLYSFNPNSFNPEIAPPFGTTDPKYTRLTYSCDGSTPTVAFVQNCTDWTCSTCDSYAASTTWTTPEDDCGGFTCSSDADCTFKLEGYNVGCDIPSGGCWAHLANCAPRRRELESAGRELQDSDPRCYECVDNEPEANPTTQLSSPHKA